MLFSLDLINVRATSCSKPLNSSSTRAHSPLLWLPDNTGGNLEASSFLKGPVPSRLRMDVLASDVDLDG